jgi:Signal transduction histidine kinase
VSFNIQDIDKIIKNATRVMEKSRYQIFEIYQGAKAELELMRKELDHVMQEIAATISLVDRMEIEFKRSRNRLSEVSRDFKRYREEDIRKAFEMATKTQLELTIQREKETTLRQRRDELQIRIRNIEQTIERAELVASQMNVVAQYLSGDLSAVTQMLETAKNRQLLGLRIIMAQEEERKRISREIHDGVAQSMANLVMRTEFAERMLAKREYAYVQDEVRNIKNMVRSGLEEVRRIIFNLRPMALDDLGLVPTLRKFVQDFEDRTKISTRFEAIGKEQRMQPALEIAVYRFVQEAFTNVLKHAQATRIDMNLVVHNGMMKIRISDNGIGFDTSKIQEKMATEGHFGIIGMRERVEMLDGEFQIDSIPGEGTRITLNIPIVERKENLDESGNESAHGIEGKD